MQFFKKLGNFIISRRFIINFVLFGLVWVLIIWGSMTYFKSYTNHGESVTVPNLLKNNANDISSLIGDKPLKYKVLDSIYNPDLVTGTIIYQNPMPTDSSGLRVKKNRIIKVRVSKQSRFVTIPHVVSKSERFAEAVLLSKNLRTKIKYVPSQEDQGSVIHQRYQGKDISKDQKIPINSVVELTVGKMSVGSLIPVPDLQGLTINEAKERFDSGSSLRLFSVCSDCETKSDSLNAIVVRQTPIAQDSSKTPEGSTITVFVSSKEK